MVCAKKGYVMSDCFDKGIHGNCDNNCFACEAWDSRPDDWFDLYLDAYPDSVLNFDLNEYDIEPEL